MATIRRPDKIQSLLIPLEICGIICQAADFTQCDLRSLSLISRAFNAEANHLLYASVTLWNYDHIISFCHTITRKPRMINPLHTLAMYMPCTQLLLPDDCHLIDEMLDICQNKVRHYSVWHEDEQLAQMLVNRSAMTSLVMHDFKLKSFSTNYFVPGILAEFLQTQSDTLEELVIECGSDMISGSDPSLQGVLLPQLKRLSCTNGVLHDFLSEESTIMKLEQVHLAFVKENEADERRTTRILSRFSKTLKSLSITRYQGFYGHETAGYIKYVAKYLPDIKFLRILDYTLVPYEDRNPPVERIDPAKTFKDLKTLIVLPVRMRQRISRNNASGFNPAYKPFWSERGIDDHANEVMREIPTLNRVVFITNKDFYEYSRASVPEDDLPEDDPYEWPLMVYKAQEYEEAFGCVWARH
ncbi:hypothetical protein BDN70DRAFT_936866 [Pholiota conissans]|uniref:Uncharacterized protein n=1 Tax=Pholiota conissans TaxID=109636 RepID=A0A9P6CPP1_9AGAR|nr:hypothetical protein BDN70DRAFT_936866 [Pholiota conissans]